jgi:hypothetical protein
VLIVVRPRIQIVGHFDHADFFDVAQTLRIEAEFVNSTPELIIIAQRRPGEIGECEIDAVRRKSPLAGVVGVLGSWCEGETRTGRPWPGVERLYCYEFPAWWRRQMARWSAGRCPDWARASINDRLCTEYLVQSERPHVSGLVVLNVASRETADVLGDVLRNESFSTLWQKPVQQTSVVGGVAAGIWVGGQLSEREADTLGLFCRQMAREGAPVIAMLDFPRRDCVERAVTLGAKTVMGIPWLNTYLVATLKSFVSVEQHRRAA